MYKVIIKNTFLIKIVYLVILLFSLTIQCFSFTTYKQVVEGEANYLNLSQNKEVVGITPNTIDENYENFMYEVSNIDGVTISNSKFQDNILMLDSAFMENFKIDVFDGKYWSEKQYMKSYDGTTEVPVIIGYKYAQDNQLEINDMISYECMGCDHNNSLVSESVSFGTFTNDSFVADEAKDDGIEEESIDVKAKVIAIAKEGEMITSVLGNAPSKGTELDNLLISPYVIDKDTYESNLSKGGYIDISNQFIINRDVISYAKFRNKVNEIGANYKYSIDFSSTLNYSIAEKNYMLLYYRQIFILAIVSLVILIISTIYYYKLDFKMNEKLFISLNILGLKSSEYILTQINFLIIYLLLSLFLIIYLKLVSLVSLLVMLVFLIFSLILISYNFKKYIRCLEVNKND